MKMSKIILIFIYILIFLNAVMLGIIEGQNLKLNAELMKTKEENQKLIERFYD